MSAGSASGTLAARERGAPTRLQETMVAIAAVFFLSAFTVWHQISVMGLDWFESVQWERTQAVMRGESGIPWQYRLFSEAVVTGAVRVAEVLPLERPVGMAFVAVRLVQNALIFSLSLLFFFRLGIPLRQGLLGIGLLAWGMGHALYDADLSFNTYTDIVLYLTAGLFILSGRLHALIPLMLVAAFNRETSGCIPFMLLFSQLRWENGRPALSRDVLVVFGATLAIWLLVMAGLVYAFADHPPVIPTPGVQPILPLLKYNITWWRTWVFLFATLGILPLLAMASWKAWPFTLQRFFFAIAPVWFPLHFMLAHAPETRLFLVPQVMLFVPGALLGLGYWMDSPETSGTLECGVTPEARRAS